MGRLNEFVRVTVLNVNFLFFVLSTTLVGIATFILLSDWGTLDPNFFFGWCIAMVLFGAIIILVSVLGCLGVKYQRREKGFFTGRNILLIYQLILIGTLIAELYVVAQLTSTCNILQEASDNLSAGEPSEFGQFESILSERFNEFYFSAVDTCTDAKYHWFWIWVMATTILTSHLYRSVYSHISISKFRSIRIA